VDGDSRSRSGGGGAAYWRPGGGGGGAGVLGGGGGAAPVRRWGVGAVAWWSGGLGCWAKNKQIDLSGLISGSSGNSGTVAQYPNYQ